MNLPFKGYLRRKDAHEAADAGILLWRNNFAYFIIFFAVPFWIFAFLLRLLTDKLVILSWVFMWYLKPFFDRLILRVISVKFFEPEADLKRLFKGLNLKIFKGLIGDLLWRRFTPFRSSTMPVRVLEQPAKQASAQKNKTKRYSERKKLLNKGGLGYSFFLTMWGLAMETALLFGEMAFINIFATTLGINFNVFAEEFLINGEVYIFALWCVNYIIIETVYMCMGFGVYINSRIEVEGWDIEIMFKSFAEKLKKKKALGALSLIIFLTVFSPSATAADEANNDNVPLDKLEKALSSPDFGYEEDVWIIREKYPQEPKEYIRIIDLDRLKLIDVIRNFLASGLRLFLILFFTVAAIVFLVFYLKYFKKRKKIIINKPYVSIMSEDLRENPQDLLNKAVEYYNKSKIVNNYSDEDLRAHLRNAWGFAIAAIILSYKLYYNFIFPPNATENDCARIVKAKLNGGESSLAFNALIRHWVNFAYAGKLPPENSFEDSVEFFYSLKPENEGDNA